MTSIAPAGSRIVIYARKSVKKKESKGGSDNDSVKEKENVQAQLSQCISYANGKSRKFVFDEEKDCFDDDGVSGAAVLEDRPGFMEMIKYIRTVNSSIPDSDAETRIRYVLMTNEDRYARSVSMACKIDEALDEVGVQPIFTNESDNWESQNINHLLRRNIVRAVSEHRRALDNQKREDEEKVAMEHGEYRGNLPFGLDSVDGSVKQLIVPRSRSSEYGKYKFIVEATSKIIDGTIATVAECVDIYAKHGLEKPANSDTTKNRLTNMALTGFRYYYEDDNAKRVMLPNYRDYLKAKENGYAPEQYKLEGLSVVTSLRKIEMIYDILSNKGISKSMENKVGNLFTGFVVCGNCDTILKMSRSGDASKIRNYVCNSVECKERYQMHNRSSGTHGNQYKVEEIRLKQMIDQQILGNLLPGLDIVRKYKDVAEKLEFVRMAIENSTPVSNESVSKLVNDVDKLFNSAPVDEGVIESIVADSDVDGLAQTSTKYLKLLRNPAEYVNILFYPKEFNPRDKLQVQKLKGVYKALLPKGVVIHFNPVSDNDLLDEHILTAPEIMDGYTMHDKIESFVPNPKKSDGKGAVSLAK